MAALTSWERKIQGTPPHAPLWGLKYAIWRRTRGLPSHGVLRSDWLGGCVGGCIAGGHVCSRGAGLSPTKEFNGAFG